MREPLRALQTQPTLFIACDRLLIAGQLREGERRQSLAIKATRCFIYKFHAHWPPGMKPDRGFWENFYLFGTNNTLWFLWWVKKTRNLLPEAKRGFASCVSCFLNLFGSRCNAMLTFVGQSPSNPTPSLLWHLRVGQAERGSSVILSVRSFLSLKKRTDKSFVQEAKKL